MFKKKQPEAPLEIDSWVLARHNEDSRFHGPYGRHSECHAGQVKFHDGNDHYAVRFHFGTRWINRDHLDPVTAEKADFVDPNGTLLLEAQPTARLPRRSAPSQPRSPEGV